MSHEENTEYRGRHGHDGSADFAGEHGYDDIIGLPRHVSSRHPQMPLIDRAAQFSPFAALTGHEAAIRETARQVQSGMEAQEHGQEYEYE